MTLEQSEAGKKPLYNRVILKLSGEMMKGPESFGINKEAVQFIAGEIKSVADLGVQVGVVVGGGNIFRGNSPAAEGITRAVADQVGMLATAINALILQDALEKLGLEVRTMSAIAMNDVSEAYIRRRAIRHLEKGIVVIFSSGTGNPFFTTDSAAALRANEVNADAVLKGTKVDGIYTKDPMKYSDAEFLSTCTYERAIRENLSVMDTAALALARDQKMPITVYKLDKKGNTRRAVLHGDIGTIVKE